MTSNAPKHLAVAAAAIRPGYQVAYTVQANGKEILSRGEVFAFRRVGHNKAEITLLHNKTGSLFTNVLKGNTPVALTGVMLDPDSKDALMIKLLAHMESVLKEQASDFYTVLPIED